MTKRILSLSLAAALTFGAASAFAQKGGDVLMPSESGGWLIGPVGGLNFVTYSTNEFAMLNSEPTCFTAKNGSDIAPFFGLSAEVPLNAEDMQNFIIIEALYDSKSSKFTATNASASGIPTKLGGVVGTGSVETSETADLNYLSLNVGYKYNFVPAPTPVGPGLQLCASFGMGMTGRLNQTVTVTAVNGSQTLSSSTDIKDSPPGTSLGFRVAVRAQFTYDIPVTDMWVATPFAGYDQPFTKVDNSTRDWSASSAYAGIAFRILLGR
jgi:hypothetical protein